MAKQKKPVHRVEMTEGKRNIIRQLLEEYDIETAEDIQDALKDLLGGTIKEMMEAEMDDHLGYEKSQRSDNDDYRNGYKRKQVNSRYGSMEIEVPQDRKSTFEPQVVKKRQKDISDIDQKIISMYAKGMTTRQISETIEDIYGFEISHETISDITDCVLERQQEWQNRPLKACYPFVFIDCMYVTLRKDYETKKYAVYTMLGYDIDGKKDILGLWLNETESKHSWMQIFDEIKSRGVEDIFFLSMDGVSGLESGAKAIFKDVTVQRCMVHLIRNSVKYIPSKDYKAFTSQLKKVYGTPSVKAARAEFENLKQVWSAYPGAIDVWERNFAHVEQLYDYGSAVRKIMYTTNAVESIHSSFRKVTKQGAFPNENAILKLLYLRITELYKKWEGGHVQNWALVRNQLDIDPKIQARIRKYENA